MKTLCVFIFLILLEYTVKVNSQLSPDELSHALTTVGIEIEKFLVNNNVGKEHFNKAMLIGKKSKPNLAQVMTDHLIASGGGNQEVVFLSLCGIFVVELASKIFSKPATTTVGKSSANATKKERCKVISDYISGEIDKTRLEIILPEGLRHIGIGGQITESGGQYSVCGVIVFVTDLPFQKLSAALDKTELPMSPQEILRAIALLKEWKLQKQWDCLPSFGSCTLHFQHVQDFNYIENWQILDRFPNNVLRKHLFENHVVGKIPEQNRSYAFFPLKRKDNINIIALYERSEEAVNKFPCTMQITYDGPKMFEFSKIVKVRHLLLKANLLPNVATSPKGNVIPPPQPQVSENTNTSNSISLQKKTEKTEAQSKAKGVSSTPSTGTLSIGRDTNATQISQEESSTRKADDKSLTNSKRFLKREENIKSGFLPNQEQRPVEQVNGDNTNPVSLSPSSTSAPLAPNSFNPNHSTNSTDSTPVPNKNKLNAQPAKHLNGVPEDTLTDGSGKSNKLVHTEIQEGKKSGDNTGGGTICKQETGPPAVQTRKKEDVPAEAIINPTPTLTPSSKAGQPEKKPSSNCLQTENNDDKPNTVEKPPSFRKSKSEEQFTKSKPLALASSKSGPPISKQITPNSNLASEPKYTNKEIVPETGLSTPGHMPTERQIDSRGINAKTEPVRFSEQDDVHRIAEDRNKQSPSQPSKGPTKAETSQLQGQRLNAEETSYRTSPGTTRSNPVPRKIVPPRSEPLNTVSTAPTIPLRQSAGPISTPEQNPTLRLTSMLSKSKSDPGISVTASSALNTANWSMENDVQLATTVYDFITDIRNKNSPWNMSLRPLERAYGAAQQITDNQIKYMVSPDNDRTQEPFKEYITKQEIGDAPCQAASFTFRFVYSKQFPTFDAALREKILKIDGGPRGITKWLGVPGFHLFDQNVKKIAISATRDSANPNNVAIAILIFDHTRHTF